MKGGGGGGGGGVKTKKRRERERERERERVGVLSPINHIWLTSGLRERGRRRRRLKRD